MLGDFVNDEALGSAQFATTCWTMVVAAGEEDPLAAQRAMEFLCQRYWSPLYFYLRRWGCNRTQAEDFVQGFFAHLLENQGLQSVKREQHRFRSFLRASLKNFVIDEHRRARRKRRGGGQRLLPLEFDQAESRYSLEPADQLSADKLFDRAWAMSIIERAMEALAREYANTGKSELFERLRAHITSEPDAGFYHESADRLGMSAGSLRAAAYRLRRRLRELIRREIAETVTTAEQVEEEIRDLFAAFEP